MASGEHIDPLIGAEIDGRYRIEAPLGAGGMGLVYRARQLNIDRPVAVKVLLGHDPALARRFETEARIIATLRDPHTLKLIDFGRMPDGRLYIVSEFLDGEALDARLKREGALEVEVALRIARQICDALTEAHELHIVHRDLKPANIFIERIGQREVVRVLDFGIARWREPGGDTTTGPIYGTPDYMAPEQAQGEAMDGRADLYSLGAVLYECLTGRVVYEADSAMAIILRHIQDRPRPFDALKPPVLVPDEVEALVMSLLEREAEDRPANAQALAQAIDALSRPAPVAPAPPPPPRRSRAPAFVGLLVIAFFVGWWALRAAPAPPAPDATRPAPSPQRPPDAARPIDAGARDARARPDAAVEPAPPRTGRAPKARSPRPKPPRRDAGRPDARPPKPDAERVMPGGFIRVVPAKPK